MDRGIWAIWYNLPEENREEYFDWLHEVHLPTALERPGILWAAHYQSEEKISRKFGEVRLSRTEDSGVPAGDRFILLLGGETAHTFFNPTPSELKEKQTPEANEMLGRRIGERSNIFAEESRMDGPEAARRGPGMTGEPAAVFTHVTVGTANSAAGIMNASRMGIPMIVLAGRTPIFEKDAVGARNRRIHWPQESFDQASMIREYLKWDYELRDFAQLNTVVDRAIALAKSSPQGPVYLTLPREQLAVRQDSIRYTAQNRFDTNISVCAGPENILKAGELIASAKRPLVLASHMGRNPKAVGELVKLAEDWALPVVESFPFSMNFPADNPLHLGFSVDPYLEKADLVIAVEADVPWIPSLTGPGEDVPVIQIARDPLFSAYPIRGFPLDVALAGDPVLSLAALRKNLEESKATQTKNVLERKAKYQKIHEEMAEQTRELEKKASEQNPINMYWVSHCLGEVADEDTIFLSEYDLKAEQLHLCHPGSYFGSPSVSGLGWGFGAAIGAKLGAPEKTVICGLGDGAYLFSNPIACHMAAAAHNVPILVVVFNNGRWNSVGAAVGELAPDGWAVSNNDYVLVDLKPAPNYERISEDCGGYGERVEDPSELPAAIQRALHEVRVNGRQALLNVICA